MKKVTLFFAMLFVTITLNAQVKPTDTDGDGYYNISTLDHLRWVSENNSCWEWNFELDNDIDAGDTKNWNNGAGWSPIGYDSKSSYSRPFRGNFDGQGFIIDSLYVNRPYKDYVGLFGSIMGYNTFIEIKNIGLSNCNVTGKNNVGGLVGYNYYLSTIINCYSTGSIAGKGDYVGGLVGMNETSIIAHSYSMSSVGGTGNHVGGLVGYNLDGVIGYNNYSSSILFCYSTGSVAGTGDYVGGLVGMNKSSNIRNSYTTSIVTGSSYVGGLVGKNNDFPTITNSYATGSVNGDKNVGGLAGWSENSTITNCYSTGSVAGMDIVSGFINGGGDYSKTTNSFWDTETSGLSSSAAGTPKTTTQMKTKSTFTDAGWDFETIWAIDGITNDGYPYFDTNKVAVTENILPTTNLTCSPNPCSTSSTIGYSVNNAGFVNIAVYDMLGNEVAVLMNNYQATGEYEVIFNAEEFSAGVYFITINTAATMETQKIIVAR